MERSLIRKEVLPFLGMFGALIVLTMIIDALLHLFDLVWVGLTAMLVNVISGMTRKYLLDRSRRFVAEKTKSYAQRGLTDEAIEKELFWDATTLDVMKK